MNCGLYHELKSWLPAQFQLPVLASERWERVSPVTPDFYTGDDGTIICGTLKIEH